MSVTLPVALEGETVVVRMMICVGFAGLEDDVRVIDVFCWALRTQDVTERIINVIGLIAYGSSGCRLDFFMM